MLNNLLEKKKKYDESCQKYNWCNDKQLRISQIQQKNNGDVSSYNYSHAV